MRCPLCQLRVIAETMPADQACPDVMGKCPSTGRQIVNFGPEPQLAKVIPISAGRRNRKPEPTDPNKTGGAA